MNYPLPYGDLDPEDFDENGEIRVRIAGGPPLAFEPEDGPAARVPPEPDGCLAIFAAAALSTLAVGGMVIAALAGMGVFG